MFRRSYNRALVRIELTTATPLLIRAGDTGLSPTVANLSCVRTNHGIHGRTVYIPGSSLKGVMRQAAEATVRGRDFNGGGGHVRGACDPLDHKASCYGAVRNERKPKDAMSTEAVYRMQCLACRTFGSLAIKGRTSVRDLFPWDDGSPEALTQTQQNRTLANQVEMRHGVAISRVTGSVQVGPFDQEVVPAGVRFWGEIALENYQLWQLGLLVQAIDELDTGFARLGSSTSRGLGEVRAAVQSIAHEQALGREQKPAGVGAIASSEEKAAYGLFPERPLQVDDTAAPRGLVDRFTVTDAQRVTRWREASLEALRGLS
jgi:CRISPR-associated RAMP protein (TIGR02581 family)